MKPCSLFLLFGLLTLCVSARAGVVEILQSLPDDVYSVSKDRKKEWQVNERICFRRVDHQGKEIDFREIVACGQVLDILDEDFLVHITSKNVKLSAGSKVKAWRPGANTYQRAAEFAKRTIATDVPDPLDQRYLSAGIQFLAPFLHIEQGITKAFSIGFQPSYLSTSVGNGEISGFGYHATLGYHYDELFQGPWGLLGVGAMFYQGKLTLNEFKKESLSFHGSVGWRFLFWNKLSVGVSLGGQYVMNHTFSQFVLGWNGFLPVALLQVGYKF